MENTYRKKCIELQRLRNEYKALAKRDEHFRNTEEGKIMYYTIYGLDKQLKLIDETIGTYSSGKYDGRYKPAIKNPIAQILKRFNSWLKR